MKKLILLFILISALLVGCKKENEKPHYTIQNLSGVTWYNAEVWFRNTPGGELEIWQAKVGMVENGSSCSVETDCSYFYIYAKDYRGKMIMSKDIKLNTGTIIVKAADLY